MTFAPNLTIDSLAIEPEFKVSEKDLVNLCEMKLNQHVKVIINFTVIERTKNFTILRVEGILPKMIRRIT